MSRAILGETFDIHGGGLDLVFPHHENEIGPKRMLPRQTDGEVLAAQRSVAAAAAETSATVGGRSDREEAAQATKKVSRSEGAGGLADVIASSGRRSDSVLPAQDPLSQHRRLSATKALAGSRHRVGELPSLLRATIIASTGRDFYNLPRRWQRQAGRSKPTRPTIHCCGDGARRAAFLDKMDDDFNTGGAIGELFDIVRLLNKFVDQHQLESALLAHNPAAAVLQQRAARSVDSPSCWASSVARPPPLPTRMRMRRRPADGTGDRPAGGRPPETRLRHRRPHPRCLEPHENRAGRSQGRNELASGRLTRTRLP